MVGRASWRPASRSTRQDSTRRFWSKPRRRPRQPASRRSRCYDHLSGTVLGADRCLDVWSVLGAVATSTSRVRLGPLVVNVTTRHPIHIAVAAATLQSLAGGRLVLGLGAGSSRPSPYAAEMAMFHLVDEPADRRRARVAETIGFLRGLWSGAASFEGNGPLPDTSGVAVPTPMCPMVLGANGPRMAELAGRLADGVNFHSSEPALERLVDIARHAAGVADRQGFEVSVEAPFYVNGSTREARRASSWRRAASVRWRCSGTRPSVYERSRTRAAGCSEASPQSAVARAAWVSSTARSASARRCPAPSSADWAFATSASAVASRAEARSTAACAAACARSAAASSFSRSRRSARWARSASRSWRASVVVAVFPFDAFPFDAFPFDDGRVLLVTAFGRRGGKFEPREERVRSTSSPPKPSRHRLPAVRPGRNCWPPRPAGPAPAGRLAGLGQDFASGLRQAGGRRAQLTDGAPQVLARPALDRRGLCGTAGFGCVQEPLDHLWLIVGDDVEGPVGRRGLAQLGHLGRLLTMAVGLELLDQRVASGDELVWRQGGEVVGVIGAPVDATWGGANEPHIPHALVHGLAVVAGDECRPVATAPSAWPPR